ncbi:MAG: ATP-binding protein [Desulfovibrionaceae bacterium]|nr:ATP-binding protein [Desulfovibrionaceae bacterium]
MNATPVSFAADMDFWKERSVFDVLPVPMAVLSRRYDIVYANREFKSVFGPWEGRKCWQAYHKTDTPCKNPTCANTFKEGRAGANKGSGLTTSGQIMHYTKYSIPLGLCDGKVEHIMQFCVDRTAVSILRREYQSLFDLVPCSIVILNKQLRITDSNKMVEDIYGDLTGKHCYSALKGEEDVCADCIAGKAFSTRKTQYDDQVWMTPDGEMKHYQITAVPIVDSKDEVDLVMEMAVDITELTTLREQREMRTLMLSNIVSKSLRGIVVMDTHGEVPIVNPAARRILDLGSGGIFSPGDIYAKLPDHVVNAIHNAKGDFSFNDLTLFPERGEDAVLVHLGGQQLRQGKNILGLLLTFQDLREIRRLEREKLEAERMGAVGQTVSGLAHGVKNLVTALEGGMYMLSSGMNTGKAERIAQGMDMLQRNIERIGTFVKTFLSFARGREIRVKINDPVEVAKEVVDLYRVRAAEHQVRLEIEADAGIAVAPLDYESLHESLTNLVGNAIDACMMNAEKTDKFVRMRVLEKDGVITYEVSDNGCGMDYAVKQKVFTNFFTTKGQGGTGLGLLMTKKIVQEHGGYMEMESEFGQGTSFRICLPRARLPKVAEETEE